MFGILADRMKVGIAVTGVIPVGSSGVPQESVEQCALAAFELSKNRDAETPFHDSRFSTGELRQNVALRRRWIRQGRCRLGQERT